MAQLIADSPEPVAIAPIGPLTNIALLLRLYPHLTAKIAHICLMGGSIGEGNTTAAAEFNIVADPEAADVVFRSGVPITMIGLDVTHMALLDRAASQALRDLRNTSGRIAAELTDYALDRNMEWSGATTTAIHDAVAIAHFIVPDLVAVAPYHVAVETSHGPARGGQCDEHLPRHALGPPDAGAHPRRAVALGTVVPCRGPRHPARPPAARQPAQGHAHDPGQAPRGDRGAARLGGPARRRRGHQGVRDGRAAGAPRAARGVRAGPRGPGGRGMV